MQSEQNEKLERLVQLGIITDLERDTFKQPRVALKAIESMNILEGWIDMGNHYYLTFINRKPVRLHPKQVWEAIADKLLETKDPIGETAKKETPKQEEQTEEQKKEIEKIAKEYTQENYEELTSEKLSEILKEKGLPFSGSKTQKLERLKEANGD